MRLPETWPASCEGRANQLLNQVVSGVATTPKKHDLKQKVLRLPHFSTLRRAKKPPGEKRRPNLVLYVCMYVCEYVHTILSMRLFFQVICLLLCVCSTCIQKLCVCRVFYTSPPHLNANRALKSCGRRAAGCAATRMSDERSLLLRGRFASQVQ